MKGKRVKVPAMDVYGNRIVISGNILKIARLKEEWYEDIIDPDLLINCLKKARFKSDIFTFWQRFPEVKAEYDYYREIVHVGALPITTYDDWWQCQIKSKVRRMVRKAEGQGVEVHVTQFDNNFVHGMTEIFNETPIRQGKRFWHYGKTFDTIKHEFSENIQRHTFLGAYIDQDLIGFIILADAGASMKIVTFVSKVTCRDKAPNNALLAKAIKICCKRGYHYLVYGYWNEGTLGAFMRHNGFEKINLIRYYIPLSLKGQIVLKMRLHHNIPDIIPKRLKLLLISLRKKWFALIERNNLVYSFYNRYKHHWE